MDLIKRISRIVMYCLKIKRARFEGISGIRHWKSFDPMPTHYPEISMKEILNPLMALKRKLNVTKNTKLSDGYGASLPENV